MLCSVVAPLAKQPFVFAESPTDFGSRIGAWIALEKRKLSHQAWMDTHVDDESLWLILQECTCRVFHQVVLTQRTAWSSAPDRIPCLPDPVLHDGFFIDQLPMSNQRFWRSPLGMTRTTNRLYPCCQHGRYQGSPNAYINMYPCVPSLSSARGVAAYESFARLVPYGHTGCILALYHTLMSNGPHLHRWGRWLGEFTMSVDTSKSVESKVIDSPTHTQDTYQNVP